MTSAVSPGLMLLQLTACHATDNGSARAATSTSGGAERLASVFHFGEGLVTQRVGVKQLTGNVIRHDVQVGLRNVGVGRQSSRSIVPYETDSLLTQWSVAFEAGSALQA